MTRQWAVFLFITVVIPLLIAGISMLSKKPLLKLHTELCARYDMTVHDKGCVAADGKEHTLEWRRVPVAKGED